MTERLIIIGHLLDAIGMRVILIGMIYVTLHILVEAVRLVWGKRRR